MAGYNIAVIRIHAAHTADPFIISYVSICDFQMEAILNEFGERIK